MTTAFKVIPPQERFFPKAFQKILGKQIFCKFVCCLLLLWDIRSALIRCWSCQIGGNLILNSDLLCPIWKAYKISFPMMKFATLKYFEFLVLWRFWELWKVLFHKISRNITEESLIMMSRVVFLKKNFKTFSL